MKKVIYTSIFGNYDKLHHQEYIPEGYDLIVFTDSNLKSNQWEVRKDLSLYEDNVRNAKRFKILPHRFLKEYEISVYIDGNYIIKNDINVLVERFLSNNNAAFYDHNQQPTYDKRNCIYQEAQAIKYLYDINNGSNKKPKDNLDTIFKQISKYKNEDYPEQNGLINGGIILRRHNEKDCIKTMEDWWTEIKYNSRRDQLSFNYIAWKNNFKFNYLEGHDRTNEYFNFVKHTKHNKNEEVFVPISLDYFLNMELQTGGGGKEMVTNNYTLKTVKDVDYYSDTDNYEKQKSKLNSENFQYFNCIIAEFKKNVGDHHELGWDKMTEEYYSNLENMSDDEIEKFLKENPVEFDNGFVRHGFHRACAMIGRLINGKKYFPFYMRKERVFDEPRKKDGIQRRFSLSNSIKGIKLINELKIPRSEFTICQSGILTLMGIRENNDLDIIISSEARKQLFNDNQQFMRFNGVEIFEPNKSKFRYFEAQGDDDLIDNYSFQVDGYNFLEPRFYFSRKNRKTEKDLKDWECIRMFLENENHKGYPFNELTDEQWGVKYLNL